MYGTIFETIEFVCIGFGTHPSVILGTVSLCFPGDCKLHKRKKKLPYIYTSLYNHIWYVVYSVSSTNITGFDISPQRRHADLGPAYLEGWTGVCVLLIETPGSVPHI